MIWNAISRIKLRQTSLSCIKSFIFFPKKRLCQPTILPKL